MSIIMLWNHWIGLMFLVAQTISQLRSEALLKDNIYHSLNNFLTNAKLPDFIDTINLTEIDIGDDFPIFQIVE